MVYSREAAAKRAENARTNQVGTCQKWTREVFGAPSVGDRDRDGDADAVDGWASEPVEYSHKDRNPPRGVPVSFFGGSHGYGHRAVSLGGGKIRSTDMSSGGYSPGKVGTTTIEQIEKSMRVTYRGWSDTISGIMIPTEEKKPAKPKTKTSRGVHIDEALVLVKKSKGSGARAQQLKEAREALEKLPFIK